MKTATVVRVAVAFLFVFGAACAEEHQTREANQSEIRVREVPGDELAITRVEQDGAISGQVSIHLGDVFLAEEDRHAVGRAISVSVGEFEATHESEGVGLLQLPLRDPAVAEFLSDPRVAGPLARWNVTFQVIADDAAGVEPSEVPYMDCYHQGASYTSCCRWTAWPNQWEYRCVTNPSRLVHRQCHWSGPSCIGGKNYMTAPMGCWTHDSTVCPDGTWAAEPGSTWMCFNDCGAVGVGGCSVCWQQYADNGCITWEEPGNACSFQI